MGLSPALWGVVLALLLYGLAEGSMIPALQDTAAGAAPTRTRGAVVALWVGSVRLGQTTGPVAASVTAGAYGTGTAFVAGAALALALVAFRGTHPVHLAQE
jgi:MFS family permease